MSSEIEHPRQRTVAELLAEHGGATPGRRRRRRAAEGPEGSAGFDPASGTGSAPERHLPPPSLPARALLGERIPQGDGQHTRRHGFPEPPSRELGPDEVPQQQPPRHSGAWPAPGRHGSGEAMPRRVAGESAPELPRRRSAPAPEAAGPPPARQQAKPWAGGDPNGPRNGAAVGAANGAPVGSRNGVPSNARNGAVNGAPAGAVNGAANGVRPGPGRARERPTDMIPRVRDGAEAEPLTRPISRADAEALAASARPDADEADAGPATEAWTFDPDEADGEPGPQQEPGARREHGPRLGPDPDAGPATMVGTAPPGAEAWHRRRVAAARPGAVTPAPMFDDAPAGLGGSDGVPVAGEPDQAEDGTGGGLGSSAGQAWAAVIAQWVAGAVSGAVLWVAFRFLWRSLPVVALAAAILVTAGLVVVVRALLRNDDTRTTVFAVLVGVLLTVSPAILALLGR